MTSHFSFQVEHVDSSSHARLGKFATPHGVVDTPVFMPVGTQGTVKGVDAGRLVDRKARESVDALVQEAVAGGAKVLTGGGPLPGKGWFYAPTVLTDVPATSRIAVEEIFGPVAPISTFATEAEAIARANDTAYGLAAYAFTRDLARALRVSEELEFGMVGINQGVISNPAAPFGGMKASGFGREGGFEGIDEYLEVKYVGIAP